MEAHDAERNGARAALREATRDIHERLHSAPAFLAIADQRLDRRGYGELLTALAELYFPLADVLDLDPHRMDRLRLDLADLSAPEPSGGAEHARLGKAEKLGWQYVVEGSIFGGQVIYRQLDYLLQDERGRQFFSRGEGAAERWRTLCGRFESECESESGGGLSQMLAGSRAAFAAFERRLMSEPVHG